MDQDWVYLTQLQEPKNYRLTLNYLLEQLPERGNWQWWILLNSFEIKIYMNIRERNSFAGHHDREADFWIPSGKRYFLQLEHRVSQNEILAQKNPKPVAVSLLLINSEITGRLEMKEGNRVTNSHRWNKSGTRQKRSKKSTEHLFNTVCFTKLCQN